MAAARFLAAIAEHELAEQGRRRIERHLAEARLPARKDPRYFRLRDRADALKAQVLAITAGDSWLAKAPTCCSAHGGGKATWPQPLALP